MTSYVSLLVCMISGAGVPKKCRLQKLVKKSHFVQTAKFFRRSYFNNISIIVFFNFIKFTKERRKRNWQSVKKKILLYRNHLTVKLFQLLMTSQYSHIIFLRCRKAIFRKFLYKKISIKYNKVSHFKVLHQNETRSFCVFLFFPAQSGENWTDCN